ncbi:MAG TPA: phosphate signaling complex protein PhoU [Gaiellaceae bacterium]|jgi:phosphate transport system protein
MRSELQRELDRLESLLQSESDLVMRSLRAALAALTEADANLAEEVIRFDDAVDSAYLELEQGIQNLLARQTPVASDLRLVLAILHVNHHLERMADYCVTIAKLVKLTASLPRVGALVDAFAAMGSRTEEMIRVAVDSFAARDAVRAETLVGLDELIDRANRHAVEQVFAIADDLDARRWGLRMLIVSRCLERIGDHAVDIGEQTAYLVTGEFREYTDASRPSLAGA